MRENQKAFQILSLIALGVLVVLRLILVIQAYQDPLTFVEVDSSQYIELAEAMRLTGEYKSQSDDGMDLLRPPGYPLFLLLALVLGNGALNFVPVLQMLVVVFAVALLYRTGLELGSKQAGLAAVLLYLMNPNAIYWSLSLLGETLTAFWLTLSVFSAVKYWKTGRKSWLFLSGAGLSAGAITRPIILPLSICVAVLLVWMAWRDSRSLKKSMSTLAVVILGVFMLVLPWQVRNAFVHGKFTLSEVGESTFQNWMVAKTMAQAEGLTREAAVAIITASPDPMAFSLQYVREHPAVFLKEQFRGIVRTLLGAEYSTWAAKIGRQIVSNAGMLSALLDRRDPLEFLHSFSQQLKSPWFLVGLYALGYDLLLYGLCVFAVWKTFKRERGQNAKKLVLLLILTLAFLLLAPLGAGESRFRAPADPLLGLLAGMSFRRLKDPI